LPIQKNEPMQNNNKSVEVTVTYLEQNERPILATPVRPHQKTALMRAEEPPVHFYRYLYQLVGEPYNWISRRDMTDSKLAEIIHDPAVYIYVLYVDGVPGGFAEIDGRARTSHDIRFFGLAPDLTGAGLGRYFLTHIVNMAWDLSPKCLRVETSSLDHPAALPLYQQFGFQVFNRQTRTVKLASP